MNLANKLTMLRIILIPVFVIFVSFNIPYGAVIATIVFIVASITDKLDGYIARSRNEITNFGKFMDPLADKLLVTAALIALVQFGLVEGYVVVIILAREFAVSGLRTVAAADGVVIAASPFGKLKTVIQMVAITIGLVTLSMASLGYAVATMVSITNILMFLAVAITIISGIDYFIKNKGAISTNK